MRAEFIVFFITLVIFLYVKLGGKISMPGVGNVGSAIRSLLFREQIATTILFALFLITFSYAFGNSWGDVFRWWKESQMAVPLLLAVIGIILFANCKWRKVVNNGLMFLVGTLIVTTFTVNAFMGWWTGGDKKETPAAQVATTPQPEREVTTLAQTTIHDDTPPPEKEGRATILAHYGVFTTVDLPPMKELVKFGWKNAPNGCVVAVVHDDAPKGEELPCGNIVKDLRNIKRIGFASDIPGESLLVKIWYTYVPLS